MNPKSNNISNDYSIREFLWNNSSFTKRVAKFCYSYITSSK